jgi:hypothetical protein
MALLKTVTMQNVAWETTRVSMPSSIPNIVRNALARAMPVTTPGRAMGRMISRETVSRPKKRNRCSARAAIVPSTSAMAVATSATSTETTMAFRAPSLSQAATHHCVV